MGMKAEWREDKGEAKREEGTDFSKLSCQRQGKPVAQSEPPEVQSIFLPPDTCRSPALKRSQATCTNMYTKTMTGNNLFCE
jgi:hypothetical protein